MNTNSLYTQTLITCENANDAYIIQARLEQDTIDCFLTNENFTNLMPLYNNMMGSGIQVIVFEKDFIRARSLVMDYLEPDHSKLVCPKCGSDDIQLGIGKHKGFKIFNLILAALLLIPVGFLKPKFYCKTCREEIL